MPATSGCTSRSNTSRPRRRRANEATLSSARVQGSGFRVQVDRGGAARDERLGEQAEFAGQAEKRRAEQRAELSRRHQVEAVGNRNQSAVADDECAAAGFVGREQLVGNSQAAAKVDGLRQLREKVVGRALDEKAVAVDRVEHAAERGRGFEQRQLGVRQEFVNAMRRGQAGDAAADDGDAGRSGAGGWSRVDGQRRKLESRSGECRHCVSCAFEHPLARKPTRCAGWVPGPVGARVGAEAPFEAEGEREVVLRRAVVVPSDK